MRITKYGSYDATHDNNILTLAGKNLATSPTGTTEIWITGAGSNAATGIIGNTWVIRTPDGTWHKRTPGPSGQRGQYKKDEQGRWTIQTEPTTPEQNQTLEAARNKAKVKLEILATQEIKNRKRLAGTLETIYKVTLDDNTQAIAVHQIEWDKRDIISESLHAEPTITMQLKEILGDDPNPASIGFVDNGERKNNPTIIKTTQNMHLQLVYDLP